MSGGFVLTESNAPRRCECGDNATAYVHGEGFYCGGCDDRAPEQRAPTGGGGSL